VKRHITVKFVPAAIGSIDLALSFTNNDDEGRSTLLRGMASAGKNISGGL
jgi:hypothetical protein